MRTLDRYVTREFLRLFLLFVIAAPMLFVLGDLTDNLDTYTENRIPTGNVLLSYVYQFPLFVLYSLPIAALIATVFTVNNMSRHAEMTAAKAGGISFFRVLAVLPFLGLLITAGGLALSEVVPITLQKRARLLEDPARHQGSRIQFVYRSADGMVYAVRQLDVDVGRIYGLVMEREGDGQNIPTLHAIVREAAYDTTNGWTFLDGHLRLFLPNDESRTFKFKELKPVRFRETPQQLLAQPKEPDEMRYRELESFIEILERSGGKPLDLKVDLALKLAVPLAAFVIILFGAPLANTQARGGPAFGIGVSLGITILYLMMLRVAEAAGAAGTLPTMLAAWLPNGVFFVVGLVLLARSKT